MSVGPGIAQAFDAIADTYDHKYTANPSMTLMRRRVWRELHARIKEGHRILELGCGTGEDAVFLAESGCEVLATDCSSQMLECGLKKAAMHGLKDRIVFRQLDLQDLGHLRPEFETNFNGILSNFGGLNTFRDLTHLDDAVFSLLKPGGWFMAVVMGPRCLWDWGTDIARFRFSSARDRRPMDGTTIALGGCDVPCYFPPPEIFLRSFGSLKLIGCQALGLLLPPPRFTQNRHGLFWLWKTLETLERPMAKSRLLRGWGDHYLIIMKKP